MHYDILVTRHPSLRIVLEERGVTCSEVKEHVTFEDVIGKTVVGVLPLSLAAEAASVTTLEIFIPAELRGKEISVRDLRHLAGELVTYKVTKV